MSQLLNELLPAYVMDEDSVAVTAVFFLIAMAGGFIAASIANKGR